MNKAWFEIEDSNEAAKTLFTTIRQWDATSGIQQQNMRNMRLYSNRDLGSLSIANFITNTGTGTDLTSATPGGQQNRVSINVIKSCVDTLVAKIAKNKIKVSFLTSGGTLEQQTRGRNLTKFMYGHQQDTDAFSLYKLCFRDACIFGTGAIKTIKEGGKIKKERVFPDEIIVDPADSYYGDPRSLFHRRFVAKQTLKDKFPKQAADIDAVKAIEMFKGDSTEPMLLVVEAWRQPRGETGRHLVCIDGVNLVDEEWKHDHFPFSFLKYCDPMLGFFGSSLPEEIAGIQLEINRVTRHIQESQRLISHPRIFHEMTSKFNPAHFVNGIGTFIPYSGVKPTVDIPQSVGVEVYNWLENLVKKAYEIVGISQLSAMSHKPAGLDSGKALREYSDIESERFITIGQAYERFIVEDCLRSCMLFTDNHVVSSSSKENGLEKLRWGDIKLPMDEFTMQVFPVSALPQTPAAKLQMVTELKNEGYLTPEEAANLLDYPDLDSNTMTRLAPTKLVKKNIEDALLEGKYTPPEPFIPLAMALQTAQRYFCWAQLHDFPEKRLELVQRYIEDVIALQMSQQPPMPTTAAPGQQIMDQQLAAPVSAQQPLAPAIQPTV
jgi:hypothetical protein